MSEQYTPGPWKASRDPSGFSEIEWCVGTGRSKEKIKDVALCLKKDARLIAAAPDLLEALQFLMTAHGEQLDTAFAQAHAAIAKATGSKR
jgi:hypothetical protein